MRTFLDFLGIQKATADDGVHESNSVPRLGSVPGHNLKCALGCILDCTLCLNCDLLRSRWICHRTLLGVRTVAAASLIPEPSPSDCAIGLLLLLLFCRPFDFHNFYNVYHNQNMHFLSQLCNRLCACRLAKIGRYSSFWSAVCCSNYAGCLCSNRVVTWYLGR